MKAERKRSAPDEVVGDEQASMLDRIRRGDPEAAREFYDLYSTRIYRFIRHAISDGGDADAEDILQETFMALAEAIPFFRGDSSLFTFACAIAHRKTLSFIRSRARRGSLMRSHQSEAINTDLAPHPDKDLRNALASLSADHREVLVLKYIEDLTVAEIAAVLTIGEHAVESRLARARKALIKALD